MNKETSLDLIKKEIRDLYIPDAQEVINIMRENSMCIITGPFGNGKTTNLVGLLKELFSNEDRRVESTDCSGFYGITKYEQSIHRRVVNHFPITQNGVAILDEAQMMMNDGIRGIQMLLSTVREQGYQTVLPVIAYRQDLLVVRDIASTLWMSAEGSISGTTPLVYHMSPKRLPSELAKRFFTTEDREGKSIPADVADYLVNNVPLNLSILVSLRFRHPQSIEYAREVTDNYYDSWTPQYVSHQEWRDLKSK